MPVVLHHPLPAHRQLLSYDFLSLAHMNDNESPTLSSLYSFNLPRPLSKTIYFRGFDIPVPTGLGDGFGFGFPVPVGLGAPTV